MPGPDVTCPSQCWFSSLFPAERARDPEHQEPNIVGLNMRIERDITNKFILIGVYLLAVNTLMLVGILWQSKLTTRAIDRQTDIIEQETARQADESQEKAGESAAPQIKQTERIMAIKARVTAYTASRRETDNDPEHTATMERPVPGWTCAVSRDLSHWLGGRVWIEGVGVRRVNDLMNGRFRQRVDVLVGKPGEAASVSADERKVIFLGKG